MTQEREGTVEKMEKVTFKKRDKQGEIYMDEEGLKVNWSGKKVGVEKVEGDILYLKETLSHEGGAIRGFRFGEEKMKEIRELKRKSTRETSKETSKEGKKATPPPEAAEEKENGKLRALILGLERKERELRHQFDETRNFMRSWMDLLVRNLKDLEKELVLLSRKFARLEMNVEE